MIWSKLKKSCIMLCADAVKPHLQIYLTRYGPGFSHIKTRAWLTWDGEEIANFSTARWMQEQYQQANLSSTDMTSLQTSATVLSATQEQAIYSSGDFYAALAAYVPLPIEAALGSSQVIVRAVAMFDRRIGKRRLRAMQIADMTDPLVRRCYQLRCQVEGVIVGEPTHPSEER